MKTTNLFAILLATLILTPSARAVTIDTVPVGNSGNANDPATGNLYGGVGYAYNIGTTEVTVGQYTAFLNAVAADDTYSLYNIWMGMDAAIAGISRTGASGSYSYTVIGSANHPVTYVSWGDAARFSNWLNNGQPGGAEGTGTTETGAYTLSGAVTSTDLMAVARNAGAKWFIPTENEWYKAAYHQPAVQGGDSDNYWGYPMKTNSAPYSDQPPGVTPDNTRVGNFYQDDNIENGYDDGYAATGSACSFVICSANFLTNAGAYNSAPSFYGTFDQGGNVSEWNETAFSSSARGVRGGDWNLGSFSLSSSNRGSNDFPPTLDFFRIGFRVASASIPEPSTLLLLCFGSLAVLWRRRAVR